MSNFIQKPFRKRSETDRHYYKILKELFGFKPNNIELYKLALIHRSASVFLENGSHINNERLEFLGDAILEAIVSDYLFIEFQSEDEGFLTQVRAKFVNGATLNQLSIEIGLDKHVVSQAGNGVAQKHLFGDALEAIIGAIYLDKGYDFTNRLVIERLLDRFFNLETISEVETDFKSRLIEWGQKNRHDIEFITEHTKGSTAQTPLFKAVIMVDGIEIGFGMGHSKKEAEQHGSEVVAQVISNDTAGDDFLEWMDRKALGMEQDVATKQSLQIKKGGARGEKKEDKERRDGENKSGKGEQKGGVDAKSGEKE